MVSPVPSAYAQRNKWRSSISSQSATPASRRGPSYAPACAATGRASAAACHTVLAGFYGAAPTVRAPRTERPADAHARAPPDATGPSTGSDVPPRERAFVAHAGPSPAVLPPATHARNAPGIDAGPASAPCAAAASFWGPGAPAPACSRPCSEGMLFPTVCCSVAHTHISSALTGYVDAGSQSDARADQLAAAHRARTDSTAGKLEPTNAHCLCLRRPPRTEEAIWHCCLSVAARTFSLKSLAAHHSYRT